MATNGKENAKVPSKLAKLTEGVDPAKANSAQVKKLMKEYMGLENDIKAAENAAGEARKKQYAIAEKVITQTGKSPVTIEGVRYVPSCRGENVFFKNQMELSAIEL